MKSIRVENLRSFKDSGEITLSPVTLLVGQNSSGKSTFARLFPLLRQTSEIYTNEPLLWFGRLVDFGTADVSKSKFSDANDSLRLTITANIPARDLLYINIYKDRSRKKFSLDVNVSVFYKNSRYYYEFHFFNNKFLIEIEKNTITDIIINDCSYNSIASSYRVNGWHSLVPRISAADRKDSSNDFNAAIFKFLKARCHSRISDDSIFSMMNELRFLQVDEKLLNRLKSLRLGGKTWTQNVSDWNVEDLDYIELRNLIIGARLPILLNAVDSSLSSMFSNVGYTTPLRASAERYYRTQGLSLTEIDPQGQNVAMFIHNLSDYQKSSLDEWISECLGVSIVTRATEGHVSLNMRSVNSDNYEVNLADTGFGYSQLLPIVVQLWLSINGRGGRGDGVRVLSIEQPELHLHPRLQSKVASLFAKAIKLAREKEIDLNLIVETHSEQIINKFGSLVFDKQIDTEDVGIFIFNKESLFDHTTVKKSSFDSNGYLTDWPYGFFDSE